MDVLDALACQMESSLGMDSGHIQGSAAVHSESASSEVYCVATLP